MGMFIFDNELVEKKLTNYIWNKLFISGKEKKFLTNLLTLTDVIVFGGVVRDFVLNKLKQVDHRDIDLVVVNLDSDVEKILQPYLINKNSFGGFKLKIDKKEIDLWKFEETWGIKNKLPLFNSIPEYLPHTSFFNINAIAFSIKNQNLVLSESFKKVYYEEILDIEFIPNPLPALCLIKTYEYVQKYELKLSDKLVEYLKKNIKHRKQYELRDIQMKHYGGIKYSNKELLDFNNSIISGENNFRSNLHVKLIDY